MTAPSTWPDGDSRWAQFGHSLALARSAVDAGDRCAGVNLSTRGNLAEARKRYAAALDVCRDTLDLAPPVRCRYQVLGAMAELHLLLGEPHAALIRIQEAFALEEFIPDRSEGERILLALLPSLERIARTLAMAKETP